MYILRPATPADAPFLARLDLALAPDADAPPPPAADPGRPGRGDRPGGRAQRQIVLIGGQPVGVVAIELDSTAFVVAELGLLPAYRGRGVGTVLLGELLARARGAGLAFTLRLRKGPQGRHERERLEHCWGFELTGETATHWRLAHGLGLVPATAPATSA